MKHYLNRRDGFWRSMTKRTRCLAACALVLALGVGILVSVSLHQALRSLTPQLASTFTSDPARLSEADSTLYTASFDAEARGDHDAADGFVAQLENPRLVGYILAARYLSAGYTASAEELTAWLERYADHPQANDVRKLAVARGIKAPALRNNAPLKGEGYADHLGRSGMPDSWYHALSLWRDGQFDEAQPVFAAVATDTANSDWQRAAGAYWAYRTAAKRDDAEAQQIYLAIAATYSTTFYGLLASQHTQHMSIQAKAPRVTRAVRTHPQAIRAALLAQLDRSDDAEDELRSLYGHIEPEDRPSLVTLAHELNLPNLQVRLSRLANLSASEALFARYPTPDFIAQAQTEIDPALLLSIARSESGFRDVASSSAGAVGIMQILPSTAHAIERRVGRGALALASTDQDLGPIATRLNDPATSARYSAQYLKILSREPAVGNNLVRVIAAYNAGPGTVAGWQSMARTIDDPLLYIESIPFPETRNYVMQVLAQYWVYQGIEGKAPASLSALDDGEWPALFANN